MLRTQPSRSALTEPWFKACNEQRLLVQRCRECAQLQFYPRAVCGSCTAADPEWVDASGQGSIASFTVVRHAVSAAYEAPYVVALVDLAEGPRLMSNIVDCEPEQVFIGAEVTVGFERWGEDVCLPVFTLNKLAAAADPRAVSRELEEG